MARFPVTSRCIDCGSDNIVIPDKKTADTIIVCNDCGNEDAWVKIVANSLVRVRKEASIYFQERQQKFEKDEAEKLKKIREKK